MKTFTLSIAHVDEALFEGEAVSVTVPGTEGEMTILPEHTALVSLLKEGNIVATLPDNSEKAFAVEHGTVEISDNKVTILV